HPPRGRRPVRRRSRDLQRRLPAALRRHPARPGRRSHGLQPAELQPARLRGASGTDRRADARPPAGPQWRANVPWGAGDDQRAGAWTAGADLGLMAQPAQESGSTLPQESDSVPLQESNSSFPQESDSILPQEPGSALPQESDSTLPQESGSALPQRSG